jgi:modulator of FtsH protease HflC
MKLNSKIFQAIIIIIILAAYSSTYIIREGNIGVLMVLGKTHSVKKEPSLYVKWPWPISEIVIFDSRSHIFTGSEEQVLTKDQNTLIVKTHCVWKINNAETFMQSAVDEKNFNNHLNNLLRSKQNTHFGKINFQEIFNKDNNNNRSLDKLEKDLTESLKESILDQYGVEIVTAGFDKIRFPETVMEKVYSKMISDRQQESEALRAQGETEASNIRTKAKAKFDQEIAKIEGTVQEIIGQAEKESIEAYKVFAQNPDLAMGLKKIESLEKLLKNRSTIIIDPTVAPLDIIRSTMMGEH